MNCRVLSIVFIPLSVWGLSLQGEDTLPREGFASSRYEALWNHSPFAVASAIESAPNAPAYSLVGIAQIEGVSYASLIDRQNQEHFLLSNVRPQRGLTLVSITRSRNDARVHAVLQKNGQSIALQLETSPKAMVAAVLPIVPQIQRPGSPLVATLKPPMGAFLPLVFHAVDPNEMKLSKQQQDTVAAVRDDFLKGLGENPNPNDPKYAELWKKNRVAADDQLRTLLGDEIFAQFQTQARPQIVNR